MNHQDEILKALQGKETMTKTELFNAVPFGYYANGDKHFGAILSRMVNNGKLARVKRGVFKIGPGKSERLNPDQMELKFKGI